MSQLPPKHNISKQEALNALWRKGILHWKLHPPQKELYDNIINSKEKIQVVGSSRQFGKTTMLVLYAFERAIREPNTIIKFLAPTTKDVRRITSAIVKWLTTDCPKDLLPKFNLHDSAYRFANGSEIQLAGTDNGHADSIRGSKAHLCIVDEAGFCDDLDYIVTSVLLPTTTTTGGNIILISTPSKSPDHPFMSFFRKAEADGKLIKKTIYDNPTVSEKEIEIIAEALGGKESVAFRREYLVENIISEDDAVVPEFTKDVQDKCIKEWKRPAYFDRYVSMDIGGRDFTAVLFAYFDFAERKIIIEDEYIAKDTVLTDEIAANIKFKEVELYTQKTGEVKPSKLRVADNNNIILLNDLAVKHDIQFIPTLKDNKDAVLNNMRILIKTGQIIIHPRCKTLIAHLKSAIWNKARTSYTRGGDGSHFDTIDALAYLTRNINLNANPYPSDYIWHGYEAQSIHQVEEKKTVPTTDLERKLSNVFKVNRRGNFFR